MANISFTINFTLPPHDTLTNQCVVFYVGAYKQRDCYHQVHSVNAIQNWSVFCSNFNTDSNHTFSGTINTDIEIDSQCRIVLQIYAIPCCFLAEVTGTTLPCSSVPYPPTPLSLLTNPGISSYTHVIDPNNTYSNCRRYTIGTNGISIPNIQNIQYGLCNPPDAYYCSPSDFNNNVNPINVIIPPSLQNSLINTPVPNGTNINNCLYSNTELDNLNVGQTYYPPYGVIKLCANALNPPVLTGSSGTLIPPTDYHLMTNGNEHCDECCFKCRQYRVFHTADSTCGGNPAFFAYQNCRESYRLQILMIPPGTNLVICAVEGTITWLTPCLSSNAGVTYLGTCAYNLSTP